MQRRDLLALGSGSVMGGLLASIPGADASDRQSGGSQATGTLLSAADFGAAGDGRTDDTAALQAAFERAFATRSLLMIAPGEYRITRSLKIVLKDHITRQCGILAHGVRLVSAIQNGGDVIEIESRATVRFVLLQGLEIRGSGRDGHGINIHCEGNRKYFYNFCLRDIVIQNCGGDGCRLSGNVFEGQMINCYLRDNRGNGLTMAHERPDGILSAIHVMGSVFGQNGHDGAAMIQGCYDVSFHGCYFLLNQRFGLAAQHGCTLLSHCGFENNHEGAEDFAAGRAGLWLQGFGALIGCTAYSVFKQTRLIEGYITSRLTMQGCSGSGGGRARGAGLALLRGSKEGTATLIGCSGSVRYEQGFEGIEIGGAGGGLRCGSDWNSRNLPHLGEYRLWVDRDGRLRLKKGAPDRDDDGLPVGS